MIFAAAHTRETRKNDMMETNKDRMIVKANIKSDAAEVEKTKGKRADARKQKLPLEFDATIAKMAEETLKTWIAYSTAKPKHNPSAWLHRALGEVGAIGPTASAEKLTAEQRIERAFKPKEARQAKARKVTNGKKGGTR